MKPLLKRRLYCEPHSSLFFTLYVYPTKRAFHTAFRRRHATPIGSRGWVACCTMPRGIPGWCRGELGALYFFRRSLTPQIIAHEAAHAALGWWLRVGLIIEAPKNGQGSPEEERFCLVLDSLVGQIHWRCQQAGLI